MKPTSKPKTNKGLVDYAIAQLGRPYWFGTFGQTATAALLVAKRNQYPRLYTEKDFPTQYGQRVHDCVGLIKGYFWSDDANGKPVYGSNGFPDINADTLLSRCTERGDVATIPETPGVCVFMPGHVGVYIGGGWVVEARGHAYGVVRTRLAVRPWRQWGKIPFLQYS
jgi:cell wall-associated NlpC family hydrolase